MAGMWLACGWHVVGMRSACDCCVVGEWFVFDLRVVGV